MATFVAGNFGEVALLVLYIMPTKWHFWKDVQIVMGTELSQGSKDKVSWRGIFCS
ncbi:hypothetical protein MY1884_009466 [Beauveria asiatica]